VRLLSARIVQDGLASVMTDGHHRQYVASVAAALEPHNRTEARLRTRSASTRA